METKKQEAIRLAWNEKVKDPKDIDENGWVKCYVFKKDFKDDFEYSDIREETDKHFATAFKHRPKSLSGIEDHFSFKPIFGFEFYEANTLGVVISTSRTIIQKNGKPYKVSEKIMKPQLDSHGYIVFGLRRDKKASKVYLHRILAELFIPNPENKPCVNHKNGVKYDNSLSNLEWVTYQENNKHAFDTGLQKKGVDHHLYGKKGIECHNYRNINKKVIADGVLYECIEDASKALKLTQGYLYQCISGAVPNTHNVHYQEN